LVDENVFLNKRVRELEEEAMQNSRIYDFTEENKKLARENQQLKEKLQEKLLSP
jgi:hypothetical protein